MKEIKIGSIGIVKTKVTEKNTAKAAGSGSLDVFATPMMAAIMEKSALDCLGVFLDDEETSVGTMLDIVHISATPIGMDVKAQAEITAVNGREVTFNVSAEDAAGIIGKGIHKRFVVNSEKFQQKANSK